MAERFQNLERTGWSWNLGWNPNYGGYFCQATKDLLKRIKVDGKWYYRTCITEGGKSLEEAQEKLLQRVEGLQKC